MRLKQGDMSTATVFSDDPVAMAKHWAAQGAKRLHIVDLNGAIAGRPKNDKVIREMIAAVGDEAPIQLGGGIRDLDDIRALLKAGADKVSINTAAVARPEVVSEAADAAGTQCVVVAIDARRAGGSWNVYTHGGRRPTSIDAVAWAAEAEQRGAGEILLTSMDRDGTLAGYDLELLAAVRAAVSVPVIASGGAGTLDHLVEAVTEGGADAVLAASIFHDGTHTLRDAKQRLASAGLPVRDMT